jgi:integrase
MKIRISKRTVEALEPRPDRYIAWDERLAGFGVRVQPSGARSYLLQYRTPGMGRAMAPKKLTLGRHGQITADQARELASAAIARIRTGGGDPQRERSELRHLPTVARLVKLYVDWLKKRAKARSWADAKNVLELHVLPAIGRMAVADVQRSDVAAIVRRLEDAGEARTGGKVVQYVRAMFNRAELDEAPWHEMRAPGTNPCRKLEVHLGVKRTRRLSASELGSLGQTLRAAAARGENPWLIGAILLLLTGARRSEILQARWSDVDWSEGRLKLADSKTGPKSIWLSPAARAVLQVIPRLNENPYIIAGVKPGRPLVNLYGAWRRLMAEAGIEGARPHDLRRTFASLGLGQGLSLEQIGALLGHSSAQTTKGYSYLDAGPALQSADIIGAGIRQLLAPDESPKHRSEP